MQTPAPPDFAPSSIDGATFRLLADNLPTLCWIANVDGYIVRYSRRWHEYCGTTRRWCSEAGADSTVPDPHGSAADGNGLVFADHAVEPLDGERDLTVLTGPAASAQLGPDPVFVAAHRRFRVVALPVSDGTLPADAAPFGHELDVAVAWGLLVRISCAQHGVDPGWDDHLGR